MHSENFEKVKRFYILKVWNETRVRKWAGLQRKNSLKLPEMIINERISI